MSEDDIYVRTTSLLAEHFGYAPLTVVDEVINAINDIMYASTEQIEKILGGSDDVLRGTAKLESFMEHIINRNFDKFELYAFRNVFTIPEELIENGCIILDHHQGLELSADISSEEQRERETQRELLESIQREITRGETLRNKIAQLEPFEIQCRELREGLAGVDTTNIADMVYFTRNEMSGFINLYK